MSEAERLYVRCKNFGGHEVLYWSEASHAWGCLSTASVFTQKEVRSYKPRPDLRDDHATYVCLIRKTEAYVPADGEWAPLPEILKLKTLEEYLA